jgi:hypothetical protein
MKIKTAILGVTVFLFYTLSEVKAQNYFYSQYSPFKSNITTPEQFLGYKIGDFHTRHDQIVSYLKELDLQSDEATLITYGKTYEGRPLVMLVISSAKNIQNLKGIQAEHTKAISETRIESKNNLPLIINLAYNVHGNEPSSAEAALLTAYTLLSSESEIVKAYKENAVIFIDPTINPDGRERHTQWANMYRAEQLVADNNDAEHNEAWPRGRTNHYWFDLNRDWYLAIHPESRAKLNWYHQWYPNVVTDFHEMGTNSSFFFEPMKTNGSKNPIMPKDNYTTLNDLFAKYYVKSMDSIGSLYFTKEVFDGTYPGYGSSYGDLQGALALLFEQASSRGHVQETPYGDLTFAFTIRNQYQMSMATLMAAVENKDRLRKYQIDFFKSAITNANSDKIKAYTFPKSTNHNRDKAFIDKILIHRVRVYHNATKTGYIVPTNQPQYRLVQSFFETYSEYQDSVFYDASAWSLANFYGVSYTGDKGTPNLGQEIMAIGDLSSSSTLVKSNYAYIIDWDDSNAASLLAQLQKMNIVVAPTFRRFSINVGKEVKEINYGSLLLPVQKQSKSSDEIFEILKSLRMKYDVPIHSMTSGYSSNGIDLGSGQIRPLKNTKPLLLIGEGTSSYEAGEVWHHFDQKLHMPITKVEVGEFKGLNLNKYNTLILVSGSYNAFDSAQISKLRSWVNAGNTLITTGSASAWAITNQIVKEKLVTIPKEKEVKPLERKNYVDASEILGKESLGGAVFRSDIDLTHPVCFGYRDNQIPIYKNNTVWLSPSENEYSTVSKYTINPHIDGFISPRNLDSYMKNAASCIVSASGAGRVVMFADNPLFRGSFYSTERMFTNAVFFGQLISVPKGLGNADDHDGE